LSPEGGRLFLRDLSEDLPVAVAAAAGFGVGT